MISDRVALQLAGLQAQVVLGAYEEGKDQRYREVEQYLCKRVLGAPCRDWSEEVATAHKVVLLSLAIRWSFFLPEQSQKSRSIL